MEYMILATVEDACEFEEKFEDAPENIAPGFELLKAPTEDHVEFYVIADDSDDALAQFEDARAFVNQSAVILEIQEA